MGNAIQGFASDKDRFHRSLEAFVWAVESVPRGQKASAIRDVRRGQMVRHGPGIERGVRFFPLDWPHKVPIVQQVEIVHLAEALNAFMLDLHPELWPGAATFPVHDHA